MFNHIGIQTVIVTMLRFGKTNILHMQYELALNHRWIVVVFFIHTLKFSNSCNQVGYIFPLEVGDYILDIEVPASVQP